jgi:3-oxoacyl-[acyl-carrier protein] reductase
MDLGLRGKNILIVGAGADVGRATAIRCASEGARVVLAGRRRDRLEATRADVGAAGGYADLVTADLATPEGARELASAVEAATGGLDVLVNTVGPFLRDATVPAPMYGHDESWSRAFETILLSSVRLCREIIPAMKTRGRGSVIIVGANSARYYNPSTAQFGAMKAALVHLTKNWARDAGPHGVRVNAVLPGWIRGEAMASRLADEGAARSIPPEQVEAGMMRGHDALYWTARMGRPEEYADVIAFLAGSRASYVNGALVPVDGGSPVW